MSELHIYNTLSAQKEKFEPIHEGHVGMYVCGPTLYSEPHMGNIRTFISFDMIYRYLLLSGYKVKYVRNITDAGHIANSLGQEVDSIGNAARLEQMQSLEIVYKYNVKFQELQRIYNLLPPSIEPTATGHIQEQIEIIEQIMENGFAYEMNGSVYFDVKKYSQVYNYGILSGRKVEELEVETRDLVAQDEKRFSADFALWKKANPEDMQIWRSPWGDGNPGWHIECTAMSTKDLGKHFDIHGGGLDLKFPHHEDEIAQSCGAVGCNPAKYWMHTNMLNVNGKKMSKSLGNYFLPKEIIEGTSELFSKPFSAQVVRFTLMMSHYRGENDLSNEALIASERGYKRLTEAFNKIEAIELKENNQDVYNDIVALKERCKADMDDDFNTAKVISELFELASIINKAIAKEFQVGKREVDEIKGIVKDYFYFVLGLEPETQTNQNQEIVSELMKFILDIRKLARENKDWTTSDKIRDLLNQVNIDIKDGKEGTTWSIS